MSKILWLVVSPGVVFGALLGVWVILCTVGKAQKVQRILAGLIGLSLVVFAVIPIPSLLQNSLERRFPNLETLPDRISGILVLAGYGNTRLTEVYDEPIVGEAIERLLLGVELSRQYPDAQIIHTGGNGLLLPGSVSEAEVARQVLEQIGFEISRVTFEDQSRNTFENAVLSLPLVRDTSGPWIVVTSAFHMPRTMGVLKAAGWTNLIPYPTDYRTQKTISWIDITFNPLSRLKSLGSPLHEWLGLLAYYVMGRTITFFPGPDDITAFFQTNKGLATG